MNSNNTKILKYSLFLIVLGLIAGFLLGFVNSITEPIIENRKKEAVAAALKEHFDYPDYSPSMMNEYPNINSAIEDIFYTFDANGKLVSVIYKTVGQGYKSEVRSYVEIKANGTFGKAVMISNDDTKSFADLVVGHDFGITDESVEDYSPIKAGASFTSQGVISGIDAAAAHFKTIKDKVGGITND